MKTRFPYAIDTRANLAVRDHNGSLVCVADSAAHARFIVRACNRVAKSDKRATKAK